MSIVPASRLSRADLALLGNNLNSACTRCDRVRRRRKSRRLVAAINRSLAAVDEQVRRLHRHTPALIA